MKSTSDGVSPLNGDMPFECSSPQDDGVSPPTEHLSPVQKWLSMSTRMDQHSVNGDSSDTDSLPYSMTDSDTDSLVESIGSFEIESRETTQRPEISFRRPRKDKKPGPQFLQFSKELLDVPLTSAWEYIRNHKLMANLARGKGVIGSFDYLEGDGDTGSVFIANYALKFCEENALFQDTTDERYLIHKVEVRDDNSRMYAVRCVGGRYQKRYHLYFMFIKVIPHEILGEGSSSIIWRLQYEPRDPSMPVPIETKAAYLTALDNVKERHHSLYRVQRPLINQAMSATMTKRLKVLRCRQARKQQYLQTGIDEQKPEEPSEPRRSSVRLVEVDDNGDEQDGQGMLISKGKMSVDMMVEDEGGSYQDGSATQRLRRRTRSPTLRNDEDGDGQGDLKRQR
ncbi:unnamed protein product [Calypogeia fissa]